MNRSYDVLKSIYKPYRITIKGKCHIFNTTSGDYVLKERKKDLSKLYSYLDSRNFMHYVPLIDSSRDGINVYKYLDDVAMPKEQRAIDLMKVTGLLHNKTSYYKDITSKVYTNIYEDIKNNILYLKQYYNSMFDEFIISEYLSPSKYLFIRNYYELNACLNFCDNKLEEWYLLVKDRTKQRVSLVHNNLKLDHFIKNNNNDYLINFDDYIIDSPILDLIKFYKSEFNGLEFNSIFDTYFNTFELLQDEKMLLFIMISLPDKIILDKNEFVNTNIVSNFYNYIFKTEELLKPYYSKEEEK